MPPTLVYEDLGAGNPYQPASYYQTELVVSVDTVKSHVSHLLSKFGAANRVQAGARARQLGLLPLSGCRRPALRRTWPAAAAPHLLAR